MDSLKGLSFIGARRGGAGNQLFRGTNPATGEELAPDFHGATAEEVDRACALAGEAFSVYRNTPVEKRAAFLREIAAEIESLGDELLDRFVSESGLPAGRAEGERGRTCGQLRLFADFIESGEWSRSVIEPGDPERKPMPKPDTRLRYIGVGPVAVFGPANFPLAFSVAGGDTASALAAGCPVVVKAHSSHPGTGELVALAISRAVETIGLPEGVFSMLFGSGREVGTALVNHPEIQAVGFTGSAKAGRALFDLAAARPHPIPVFAEMSSINPVLLLDGALAERGDAIVEGLYGSVTLGVGQFCTNPGLVLLPDGSAAAAFADKLKEKLAAHAAAPMLNAVTCAAYGDGLQRLAETSGVECLLSPSTENENSGFAAAPALFRVSASDFSAAETLHEEVFGPTTLLVSCADAGEMERVVRTLGGQLSVTVHASDSDVAANENLISNLEAKAGRIVFNGFPTGVEVCRSMVHGGPYPATTDSRFTSVGTQAIYRFCRPVCYQDFPQAALPPELRDL